MYKFLGYQHFDFLSDDKKAIKGYKFYFAEDVSTSGGLGMVPFNCFYSDDLALRLFGSPSDMDLLFAPNVCNTCSLSFNRRGKVEQVTFGIKK